MQYCTTLYSVARKNPNGYNVGQVHVAHVKVGYSSPRSGSDPNRLTVTCPSKPFFPDCKNKARLGEIPATRGAARRGAARRVVTRRAGGRCVRAAEEEERVRESLVLTHLPTSRALHLIRWCNSSQTSNVGLNFSSHSTLMCEHIKFCHHNWALRFSEITIGLPQMGPILTIPHQISNAHLKICQSLFLVYIPVFQQRLLS